MPTEPPTRCTAVIPMSDTFEFACPTSDHDLTFEGDRFEATAECPECGTVVVCPDELIQSAADEAAIDAARDERFD